MALMIQERGDYKSLDPADILERLNTHEFQLVEKRDLYMPSYGRSRALKAKAVSSSEGEDSDSSLGDPEELCHDLALLVMKFQKFSRHGRFERPSRSNDSSPSDYKKRLCHKCKKPGHYIQDCPQWEKESKKKKYKDYSSDDAKKKKKNPKNLHHQNAQNPHLTRRAAPRRLGHSLERKWNLRLNLKKMRKRRYMRIPYLVWRA